MYDRIHLIFVTITVQLLAISVESSSEATLCKDFQSNSKEFQLKIHLFCDYDSAVRPNSENTTKYRLMIMPQRFHFDDSSGTFSFNSWTTLDWIDPHLKWNPKEFDDIKYLRVRKDEIWAPDIKIYNSADFGKSQSALGNAACFIDYFGSVTCDLLRTNTVYCDADYTNYPYDVQQCLIQMGTWSYHSDEVSLHMTHLLDRKGEKARNKEWKIVESTDSVEIETFKMDENYNSEIYNVKITLQRKTEGMHVVYIAPAIVLMVLTLTVMWLDCHSTERMIVACITFICHLICMQYLHYIIPYDGANMPVILHFYEKSFLLMGFSLVLTVLLRDLRKTSSTPPQWLIATTRLTLQSKAGQLLLLSILDPRASAFFEDTADDNEDLMHVSTKKRDSTWDYVVLLLGWIAFVAVFFAYLVMLALYLPSSATYTES